MTRIVFLGLGNVNTHLAHAFLDIPEVAVVQIYNRSKKETSDKLREIPFTSQISEIVDADIYILGVSDDAIEILSEKLPFNKRLVIHLSGGVNITKLSSKNRRGVVWPLQSFSAQRNVNIAKVPMCIEAENTEDLEFLKKLFGKISSTVVAISSSEREQLHLAAVFVNNFVNHLYSISEAITRQHRLDFDILKPLLTETAAKMMDLSPKAAQTGPAKRNDKKTIEKHLHLLADTPYERVYKMLTKGIQNEHKGSQQ